MIELFFKRRKIDKATNDDNKVVECKRKRLILTKAEIVEKLMKLLKAERMLQNTIDTIERSKLIEKLMLSNDRS